MVWKGFLSRYRKDSYTMIDKFNYIKMKKIKHQKPAIKKAKKTSHTWENYFEVINKMFLS